jgi:hypothetical protein
VPRAAELLQVLIDSPGNFSGGAIAPLSGTNQGSGYMDAVHGKWYAANYAGKVFWAATTAAGVTIPGSAVTVLSFTLYNPVASNVNLEIISWHIAFTNPTEVVTSAKFGVVTNMTTPPTSINQIASQSGMLGGHGGIGVAASTVTIPVALAVPYYPSGFTIQATADGLVNTNVEYDGKLVLPPGSLITPCGGPQTQPTYIAAVWAEWPV